MKIPLLVVLSGLTLMTSGCVTGRRTISLPIPTVATYPETKEKIYIAAVSDDRKFKNKPSDPSTPSIDGDVTTMSADQKNVMIGRQRNTYGGAKGDIGLPANESVTKTTQALFAEALKRRGYAVTTEAGAPKTASVSIDQFWSWMTPGFIALTFEARVYCTITLTHEGTSAKTTIEGYGVNKGQVASDGNWQEAYTKAFEDFLVKIGPELDKAGF